MCVVIGCTPAAPLASYFGASIAKVVWTFAALMRSSRVSHLEYTEYKSTLQLQAAVTVQCVHTCALPHTLVPLL
jgi:hypothetical protein